MSPILVTDRLHARDAAGPFGRARGAVSAVSLALGAGIHAVLGAPEDGTLALFDAITGARPPQRGRVFVAGRDPGRTSYVRARIGALSPEPRLPSAPTVRAAVRLAMRARGESGDRFDAVIDPFGLSHLHARSPRSLAFAEERALELALALSTPAPVLVVLHEPLADIALARPEILAQRLRDLARLGACVVITTSSPSDAQALADRVIVLHRGVVARESVSGEGLVLAAPIELTAWVREGARELAAALSRRPEVSAVAWEDAAESGWPGAAAVRVRGDQAEACAMALAEVAVEVGVEVEAIERRVPGLSEVRSATEAMWRMAALQARTAAPRAAEVVAPVAAEALPAEPVREAMVPEPVPEPAPEPGGQP